MSILINYKEKALVDAKTGYILRPKCFDDLAPYHSYLIGKRHFVPAQALLQKVFDGEKVISKMVELSQKHCN